jgi:AraC-like DNA-binding protein
MQTMRAEAGQCSRPRLSGSLCTYSDPEQLEAACAAEKVELLPTKRGPFEARVFSADFDRLWIHRVEESSPRLKWTVQSPQRTFFQFLTGPGTTRPVINGVSLQTNEIIHFSKGESHFEYSTGLLRWAAMSLPVDDSAANRIMIAGQDIVLARSPLRKVPAPDALTNLRWIHAKAEMLALGEPEVFAAAGVSDALKQSLLLALAECLAGPDVQPESWAHSRHDIIMTRFRRILEAEPDRPFYVLEICDAIRVPERTLRLCCLERLGMTPKQYLLLRRMHLARRALASENPKYATVTEIATRLGFWHFSRFAGCYRTMFGEAPSVTLHRKANSL